MVQTTNIFKPFKKWQTLFLAISLSIVCPLAIAQVFPVNVNTVLAPPYSVYLADYAAPGCEQLRVTLIQRDMSQASYQLFLRMSIALGGREIIRTSGNYRPSPLTVLPGVPTVISGSDLYHYLDPQNMDFIGYSRETYIRTKSLPEGAYQITFTAFDYSRPDVAVSLPGTTFCYLMKAEPPLLNMPPNQFVQPAMPVQSVLFSWLPRTVASPNSYNSTEYLLELFEIRPAGYHPNEIVNNTRPVFTVTQSSPQYMYNVSDPPLTAGMQYAWRVRAVDTQGRDAYNPDPERLHRRPLEELKEGSEIDAGGFPVTVLEATGSNGRFTGRGYIQVPMFGYARLRVYSESLGVYSEDFTEVIDSL